MLGGGRLGSAGGGHATWIWLLGLWGSRGGERKSHPCPVLPLLLWLGWAAGGPRRRGSPGREVGRGRDPGTRCCCFADWIGRSGGPGKGPLVSALLVVTPPARDFPGAETQEEPGRQECLLGPCWDHPWGALQWARGTGLGRGVACGGARGFSWVFVV